MNIAFIGLRAYPSNICGISGIDVRGETLINGLRKGNNIDVYVRNWAQSSLGIPKTKNIRIKQVFTIKNKYIDTLLYSVIASLSVCFSHSKIVFYEGTSSGILSFLPKLFRKKVIITIHSIEHKRNKWGVFAYLILYLCEIISVTFSDKIICVSEDIRTDIWNRYKKDAVVIPYFLELKKVRARKERKDRYALYLGRFTEEKRLEWLIKAFDEINQKGMKLVLAGGNVIDKTYAKKIENLTKGNKNIKLSGYVFGKEKETLLSNASLFILPSNIEGSPISLFEALSYRKPVLISAVGGLDSLFNSNRYYFNPDSYSEFVFKLKNLLNDKNHSIHSSELNKPSFIKKGEFFGRYERLLEEVS